MTLESVDFMAIAERQMANGKGDEPEQPDCRLDVLRAFGVPKRVYSVKARRSPAFDVVDQWHADPNSWCLVLSGAAGVGKSVLAGYWLGLYGAEYTSASGLKPRWYRSGDIAAMNSYDSKVNISEVCALRTLVIDDLGAEYSDQKGFSLAGYDRLIDTRYSELRKTLITTNLSTDEIEKQYQARIYDRLRDGVVYGVAGNSRRGGK